jgi:hypothetical protein
MSNADKSTLEENFAAKLGIEMTSPKMFGRLIEITAGTREVVAAVGPSGVGKTAIPKQMAARRNGGKGVPYVGLHVPTLNMEDLQIPTMASDTKTYFDRRIPRRFQVLLDWVEQVKAANGGQVPADMCPILSLEELNRAVDKAVTRALFTLLDDRYIGDVHLDDSIQIVVTMNPTGGGMVSAAPQSTTVSSSCWMRANTVSGSWLPRIWWTRSMVCRPRGATMPSTASP